jgi:hypothetical protein
VSCSADGVFGASTCKDFPKLSDITIPPITNVRLTLTQTNDSVTGDMDFAGAWRFEVRGNLRNGRLSFSSNSTIPQQGLSVAVEGWDSGLTGTNGMSGDFTMRFWVTSGAPSGSARYKVNLANVTKQ